MKGIILAGGTGSRLFPATLGVSKQLLTIYDKPMIYYPLATLMEAGVKDIAIITLPRELPLFQGLLGDGSKFGISITYLSQPSPKGLADAFLVAEAFLAQQHSCLILGDNLFHGVSFSQLEDHGFSAKIFAQKVSNPSEYGVAKINPETGHVLSLEEKPRHPESDLAVTGIYFFDGTASERSKSLTPSHRGELEIVDLLNTYLEEGTLGIEVLPQGTVWMDTGSFDSMFGAADYVKLLQNRMGVLVGSPELLAFELGYLSEEEFRLQAESLRTSSYGRKLLERIELAS
jgi:glucose-1-phosphate thymidylyltransferase